MPRRWNENNRNEFFTDVNIECESCNGKRFNRETLEIRYKGKSISDILYVSKSGLCF